MKSAKNKREKSTMVDLVEELTKLTPPPGMETFYLETIGEAKVGEYHDFKNKKYDCGKVAVVARLKRMKFDELATRVMCGEFDETADDEDRKRMRQDVIMNTKNKQEANALIRMLKLGDLI